ncbi:siderophore-interacting protein [Rhizobium halophytocola]|uniref:NADPH-dependent ferric siderophore reductase n=1 Tax=Rhizobium halophytocola TaxID=735519 RepID=A0ABS4DV52_9HYPH|nr:siderophore-interacting protein [Rhizobium halophytocola]MBP1849565.1 NADPH-dependent ferric siderophore reductase [Rhizobium halophytocola]
MTIQQTIATTLPPERMPTRHRHPVRLRQLTVARVETLSRSMLRIVLTGEELEGFASLGFDDHVKMFFPAEGEGEIHLPIVGPNGLEFPEDGPRPTARDFTPRNHDPEAGELAIDFAITHQGPASNWARAARPGDSAWIAGPRGSFVVPLAFDWHLLIADETGLPALARRLEELPEGTRAVALIEIDGQDDRIAIETRADAAIHWVERAPASAAGGQRLAAYLAALELPAGDFFTWIGCESQAAKDLRSLLIAERQANPKWMRASGYWREGAKGVHDHFED